MHSDFQANWFVAWMVLDQRRKESNRNAFCCCVKHKRNETPDKPKDCLKLK